MEPYVIVKKNILDVYVLPEKKNPWILWSTKVFVEDYVKYNPTLQKQDGEALCICQCVCILCVYVYVCKWSDRIGTQKISSINS